MNSSPDALATFLQSPLPMLLFMFVIFYFLLIRPQQRKQKEHENMLSQLQKNDDVVTASGLHGTIVNVGDKTVSVRIADNVRVEMEKSSVVLVKK